MRGRIRPALTALFILSCACTFQDEHLLSPLQPPQQDFVEQGWTSFQSGQWEEAEKQFNLALASDPANPGANAGIAWVWLAQGADSVDRIENGFFLARPAAAWKPVAWCGLAMLYSATAQYSLAIAAVDSLLSSNPRYQFPYRASLNWQDLQLTKAQALFYLQDYPAAWQSLQQLSPDSPVNPEEPASWQVNGQTYWAFPPALAKSLELMIEQYREEF